MRSSSLGPAVTRSLSIALAAAAAGVLVFTALADRRAGGWPAARPAAPSPSSAPSTSSVPTMPGTVDSPPPSQPAPSIRPPVPAARARAWLKALAGKWTHDTEENYFTFQRDGTGEWVAFGQTLWSGKATPRDARTFDLTDPNGAGPSYWQVKLVAGGKELYFAGTRATYRKATA